MLRRSLGADQLPRLGVSQLVSPGLRPDLTWPSPCLRLQEWSAYETGLPGSPMPANSSAADGVE